jgi:hypothetical protein
MKKRMQEEKGARNKVNMTEYSELKKGRKLTYIRCTFLSICGGVPN